MNFGDRVKLLNNNKFQKGDFVVYIMSRDIRVEDNHALILASEIAFLNKKNLIVVFNLYKTVKNRTPEHYKFMLEGLMEVKSKLEKLNIDLKILKGNPLENLKYIDKNIEIYSYVFDFSPLKGPTALKNKFSKITKKPVLLVDTHNIVPVWIASDKEEFGAYTLRPKLQKLASTYLIEPNKIKIQSIKKEFKLEDLELGKGALKSLISLETKISFSGGSDKAKIYLKDFIEKKYISYKLDKNDPTKNVLSNLSPYLHFGNISSLRVILDLQKKIFLNKPLKLVLEDSFVEEIFVRKELADNFCYYNNNYNRLEGARPWALKTLSDHLKDKREYIYDLREFEEAKTHDEAWNAAQLELVRTGKMHGYMRMYWAKKILEWTNKPSEAISIAIYLNDRYSLDGYDPNGYVGILWSIAGIHDRAWFERPIFGKIRYMNLNGLRRKFDLDSYIKRV